MDPSVPNEPDEMAEGVLCPGASPDAAAPVVAAAAAATPANYYTRRVNTDPEWAEARRAYAREWFRGYYDSNRETILAAGRARRAERTATRVAEALAKPTPTAPRKPGERRGRPRKVIASASTPSTPGEPAALPSRQQGEGGDVLLQVGAFVGAF